MKALRLERSSFRGFVIWMIPIQNLHKQTNYGLIVSVFIHILIFALPVSMVVKKQIQDIELFVLTEDVRMQPERIVRQKAVTVSIVLCSIAGLTILINKFLQYRKILKEIGSPLRKHDRQF